MNTTLQVALEDEGDRTSVRFHQERLASAGEQDRQRRHWKQIAWRETVVVTHVGPAGPVEVARHPKSTPGNPSIQDEHFPPAPEGPLERTPVAGSDADRRCPA